jgi:hypothetical protein
MQHVVVYAFSAGSVASALRVAQRVGSRAVGMFIKRQGSFFAEPLSTADVAEFKQLLKACKSF